MNRYYNQAFKDCINIINKKARSKGWRNDLEWANYAAKHNLITESMKIDYEKCHQLSMTICHNNAVGCFVVADEWIVEIK